MIDDYLLEYCRETALHWMLQAGQALQYMHELKFDKHVHRDIKPSNMLLDEEYRTLKLCDFGTTTTMNVKESTNMYGTEVYMAPEVFERNHTEKSDVYSWALSLEHCLTRYAPFSDCRNEQCFEICKYSIFYLSHTFGGMNKWTTRLIECNTQLEPESRNNFDIIVQNLDFHLRFFYNPQIIFKNNSGEFE